jgi:hypothetical protein
LSPEEGAALIGRGDELGELTAHTLGVRTGTVLVAGEAGIGKSSLVAALAELAAERGWCVAWGRCPEMEGAPPLWPWREVLGGLDGDDLVTLPSDGERSSFELYHQVSTYLLDYALRRRLLILLEDLHWADASSLVLLRFLAERLDASGPVLTATYRDTETSPALTDALAGLARTPSHHRMKLAGLNAMAVGELVARMSPEPVDPGVAERLRARTDGNPFFLIELMKLLTSRKQVGELEAATIVPQVVGDVIRSRLARLPEDTRAVLTIAAVAGREFSLPVVASAAGLEIDHLLDIIDSAIVTGVLVEEPSQPERAGFCHALVRETLYQELAGLRRARLHRRLARAIEDEPDATNRCVDELAYHYYEASASGSTGEALRYIALAAERARAQAAYAEAARYWRQALTLLEAGAPPDPVDRCAALAALARCERLIPHTSAARRHYREAAELAEAAGDLSRAAEAAVAGSNAFVWNVEGYERHPAYVAMLRRLLAALDGPDPRLRSLLLSSLVLEHLDEDRSQSIDIATEALALARQTDQPEVLVAALRASLVARQGGPDVTRRMAYAEEMLQLDLTQPDMRATAHLMHLQPRLELGHTNVADDLDAAAKLAEEAFQSVLSGFVAWNRSLVTQLTRPLGEAEEILEQTREENVLPFATSGYNYYWAQLLVLRWLQGRLDELESWVPGMVESTTPAAPDGAALILATKGRLEEARSVVCDPSGVLRPLNRDFTFVVTGCLRAEVLTLIADPALAEAHHADLAPFSGQVALAAHAVSLGAVDYFLGGLASRRGDAARAATHLRAAVDLNDRAKALTWAAWSRIRLGRLLEGEGDPAGWALLDEGCAAARALGAGVPP